MSFRSWLSNAKNLGAVSLEYDLERAWNASRKETRTRLKRKVVNTLRLYDSENDYTNVSRALETIRKEI